MSRKPFSRGLNIKDLPHPVGIDSLKRLTVPPSLKIKLRTNENLDFLPRVQAGDQVAKGDMIAEPGSNESCFILAPAAGTISFADHDQIEIQTFQEETVQKKTVQKETVQKPIVSIPHSSEELIRLLRLFGVRGLGGGGFPAHHKLSKQVTTLIVNGVECEPGLSCDHYLMRTHQRELIETICFLKKILNIDRCILALKESQTELLDEFSTAVSKGKDERDELEILSVPDTYPAGSEKFLIYHLTGKLFSDQDHPSEQGIVCQNVGTIFSIYRAVFLGEPQLGRILTLFDETSSTRINLEVLFGTPVEFILNALAIERKNSQLILGGMLTGKKTELEDAHVSAETNSIFLTQNQTTLPEQPCIRCGQCADVCAANLLPQQLIWHLSQSDELKKLRLADCLECGACDLVCPSHIPITSRLTNSKSRIRQEINQKKLADKTRLRFDRHLERHKKDHFLQQEKMRKERKSLTKSDLISAAINRKENRAHSNADSAGEENE